MILYFQTKNAIRYHGSRQTYAHRTKLTITQSTENGGSLMDVQSGADIGSDHHLMTARIRIKISSAKAKFETQEKRLDVQKL